MRALTRRGALGSFGRGLSASVSRAEGWAWSGESPAAGLAEGCFAGLVDGEAVAVEEFEAFAVVAGRYIQAPSARTGTMSPVSALMALPSPPPSEHPLFLVGRPGGRSG